MFPQVNTSYNHKLLLTKIHKTQIEKKQETNYNKKIKIKKNPIEKIEFRKLGHS